MRSSWARGILMSMLIVIIGAISGSCENEAGEKSDVNNTEKQVEVIVQDQEQDVEVLIQQPIPGSHIKVDQVGYLALSKKIAIVTNAPNATGFDLIQVDTGEVVLSGELTEARDDADSNDSVQQADFSQSMISGTYVISVPEVGTSYPFRIGDGVYRSVFIDTLRTFTFQRSLTDIDDSLTGYRFAAGHSQDQKATVNFSDGVSHKGDVIDVSGGWYDAGDYGKYVPPGATSAAFLLLAYDFNSEQFKTGQLAFPSGVSETDQAAGLPDLLSEVKVELDWLLKMQREDGMVYHKVAALGWPGLDVPPAGDFADRYVFGKSTYGTAIFAGTLAMASRLYEPFDKAYASELLIHAKQAFEYLEKHPEFEYYDGEQQDLGSGSYYKDTDQEDRFWAAAELLRTTGDVRYDQYLQDQFGDLFTQAPGIIGFGHPLLFGQWAYYNSKAGNKANKEKLKNTIVAQADVMVTEIQANAYLNSLGRDEYTWGSNRTVSAKGAQLLIAYQFNHKKEYEEMAMEQVHYILGRNAVGKSFVTGAGTAYTSHPHHRIVNSTMVLIPGLMVGGPNSLGGDAIMDKMKAELPPAKAYVDDLLSYSTNEYALDYNAPLSFVLAYFAEE
ncbi:MAG: glycoside hydrolase family 9 protein [Paenibacillaceae bacterium]